MDKIRALVNDDLCKIEDALSSISDKSDAILADISNFLMSNSKRIRSLVTLLYLKSQNLTITNDVISVLAITELLHNASLLHDDVIDDSHIRRGVSNLFDKYGAKISILAGDYILSVAVDKLIIINNSKVLQSFLSATKKMSYTEILQYQNRNKKIVIDEYTDIAAGKTSSLFEAAIVSCAHLLNIDAQKAEMFANLFGIIFQINNDMKPESIENDTKNGLTTIVSILGIEKTLALKDNYKEELRALISGFPENQYKKGIEDLINIL